MKKIKLDDFELRVIIRALNDSRTQLIKDNKEIDFINVLLIKCIDILEK